MRRLLGADSLRFERPVLGRHAAAPRRRYGRAMTEVVLEPDLPICDAHHHLWLARGTAAPYTLDDLRADTGSGHNVVQTVFVECHSQYRTDGPEELRPVGEVDWVASV